MVDFSVFDSILDSAFVVDGNGQVVYANDAASTFCQVSLRRMIGKANISDLFALELSGIFPFLETSLGRFEATAFIETHVQVKKMGTPRRVQLAIRPLGGERWALFLRDLTLEEALHNKYRSQLREKEEYAKNLEKIVEARTAELRSLNLSLNAILNSLGQGFFTFNRAGVCGDVYTKACQDILGILPAKKQVLDIFNLQGKEKATFLSWTQSLFNEVLPFEELRPLGPRQKTLGDGRQVEFEYHPIRGTEGTIQDIVVVATDKTSEMEALRAYELERQHATMVVRYVKNKFQFLNFLRSARTSIAEIQNLTRASLSAQEVKECFRILHTLEGEAGVFSIRVLRESARKAQECLALARENSDALEEEKRLQFQKEIAALQTEFESFLVDNRDIFQLPKGEISPLVELSAHQLESFLEDLRHNSGSQDILRRFEDTFLNSDLEDHLRYYDALSQGVAEKLGKRLKPVQFDCAGIRLRIDPYAKLLSSLVHLFRNAVDHGIEAPEEREWIGKPVEGVINVAARKDSGGMKLIIADDGRGIDPVTLRARWASQQAFRDLSAASDHEVLQTIFEPGFSTKDEMGEFSGRGVGLDALREEVLKLGGHIQVFSQVGKGSSFEIFVPLLQSEDYALRSA